jgi:hypothetical protein
MFLIVSLDTLSLGGLIVVPPECFARTENNVCGNTIRTRFNSRCGRIITPDHEMHPWTATVSQLVAPSSSFFCVLVGPGKSPLFVQVLSGGLYEITDPTTADMLGNQHASHERRCFGAGNKWTVGRYAS